MNKDELFTAVFELWQHHFDGIKAYETQPHDVISVSCRNYGDFICRVKIIESVTDEVELGVTAWIPKRFHKKKRIRKKWLRRYGRVRIVRIINEEKE